MAYNKYDGDLDNSQARYALKRVSPSKPIYVLGCFFGLASAIDLRNFFVFYSKWVINVEIKLKKELLFDVWCHYVKYFVDFFG